MDNNDQRRRLYRSRNDKMIAGVCGGLSVYFHTDPVWIRLLFLLLLVVAGSTLLVYIILWLLVPVEPQQPTPSSNSTA